MLDLVAQCSRSSAALVGLARHHLERHEWGQARLLLQEAKDMGVVTEQQQIEQMMDEVQRRLGVAASADTG